MEKLHLYKIDEKVQYRFIVQLLLPYVNKEFIIREVDNSKRKTEQIKALVLTSQMVEKRLDELSENKLQKDILDMFDIQSIYDFLKKFNINWDMKWEYGRFKSWDGEESENIKSIFSEELHTYTILRTTQFNFK